MKKKDSKKKKETTLDDLALMTQKGFVGLRDEMNERFDGVDRRFEKVDKRFDEVDKRFDKIENILIARHGREIELLRDRILKIETKLSKL